MAAESFKKSHLLLLAALIVAGWVGANGYQRAKENADDSVRFAYTRSRGNSQALHNLLYREELDRAVEDGSINVILSGRERRAEIRNQNRTYQVWDDDIGEFVDLPPNISSDDFRSVFPEETWRGLIRKTRDLWRNCEDILLASLDEEQREFAIDRRARNRADSGTDDMTAEENSRERVASAVEDVGESPAFNDRCVSFSPVPEAEGLWPF